MGLLQMYEALGSIAEGRRYVTKSPRRACWIPVLYRGKASVKTQCAVSSRAVFPAHFPKMPQLSCARQVICAGPGVWCQSEVKWVTAGELLGLD